MANVTITELTQHTTPASADVLPIVDLDANAGAGVTKKVSIADLLKNASSGTADAPGIAFDGDSNTGIYRPGDDQVAISTNGTGRLFVDANGNVGVGLVSSGSFQSASATVLSLRDTATSNIASLKVIGGAGAGAIAEYGATNGIGFCGTGGAHDFTFYTNSNERLRITSDGKVGVGTSSPVGKAEIVSSGSESTLILRNSSSSLGTYSELKFAPFTGTTAAAASIRADYYQTDISTLAFRTTNINSEPTTRLFIGGTGNVGVGVTNPDSNSQFHVVGTSYQPIYCNTTSIGGGGAAFFHSGTQALYVGTGGSSWLTGSSTADGLVRSEANLIFATNGNNQRAQIDSSGRLLVGTTLSVASDDSKLQVLVTRSDSLGGISLTNNQWYGNGSRILFQNAINSAGTITPVASITGEGDGANKGRLVFSTTADSASSPTERMRIGSNGYLKASEVGNYIAGAGLYHEFNTNASDYTLQARSVNANPAGVHILYSGASPNNTGNNFLVCDDSTTSRAVIRSNGGLANFQANDVNLSDRNAKKDISLATGTWDCIKEWEIVNYRYKDQPDDADLNLGVIAQQVAESCPEVITVFQEAKEATEDQPAQEEQLGVKEQQMYWMAIKALQEAQVRIEALEAEVAALKAQ